ncbi:CoA transferase [Leucothrix pacifica]|uniref:Acyl-CoA transferase n=1 Tax=Leucothrix pacifica TaxID=1247513 RepID=A0A317CLJ7_9GAMM|nr:CoA transferase [Leucothrix pacifica]PWQ99077.1 acyl-CoA transferase [Leucothrix pacifica]
MNTLHFSEIIHAFPNITLADPEKNLQITGSESLPAWYAVSDLAVDSIAAAGLLLNQGMTQDTNKVTVDRRLASIWFNHSIREVGWQLPDPWDSIAGNYRTSDGWVRLHTNAKAHKAAALSVLDCTDDRNSVTEAARKWSSEALADAVVEAGGCSATMYTPEEWMSHPQGKAVSLEPLIHWELLDICKPDSCSLNPSRPLEGIKILDLTRILAGPVATRFLAGYGANVLRIDPPEWDEPAAAPEVTLGKRCAALDLNKQQDRQQFETLLTQADVLVHGYRPDALNNLGYDSESLRSINPKLIDVSLCAYGWTGLWAKRRGFDSVVQMSCGIAAYGMKQAGAEQPVSLPVQALDHGTGYLMAASVIHALNRRRTHGEIYSARLSLARTACLLMSHPSKPDDNHFAAETEHDVSDVIEATSWGNAHRVKFPLQIQGADAFWPYPAGPLKTASPTWGVKQ